MAFHTEKEENGVQAIVIDGWDKGIASDPYTGLGNLLNVNLAVPGEISVGYPLTESVQSGGTMQKPIHDTTQYSNGVASAYYILDSTSKVFKSTSISGTWTFLSTSNTTTSASATNQGLAFYKNYLFKFRDGRIDYLQGGAGTWVSNWNPYTGSTSAVDVITPTVTHYALVGQDSVLYFCNGAGVGSIREIEGQTFDPTNTATYIFQGQPSNTGQLTVTSTGGFTGSETSATLSAAWQYATGTYLITFSAGQTKSASFTNASTAVTWSGGLSGAATNVLLVYLLDNIDGNALDLPVYDTAQSLAEQGTNLLTGGSLNAIYPWDRLLPGFSYPILIAENFIGRMVTVNTNVYIFPGDTVGRGNIYVTNGSQANLFYKIPDYLFGEQDPYYLWGDAIYHRGNILFGFFIAKNSGSGNIAGSAIGTAEVWAIDLETSSFRGITKLSTGANATYSPTVLISGIGTSPGMGFIVGAAVSGGGDAILGYSGTTSGIGTSTIRTDLIPVGTLFERRTFNQIEFKLRSPLEAGEDITITPIVDSVTGTAVTFDTTNTTGTISNVAPVNFEKAQWLQFLVSSTGNSATSGVRLKEIRIR